MKTGKFLSIVLVAVGLLILFASAYALFFSGNDSENVGNDPAESGWPGESTDAQSTAPSQTEPSVTDNVVTEPPVATEPPVTTAPPTTEPPVTEPPVTQPPVTEPPVTQPPVTEPPVTQPPVTEPPVTQPPVTEPPVTQPPVTEPPVTQPPVTEPPVTQPPVTEPPVTQPPVTEPPVTQPPVTEPPVTQPPVTEPPVTQPPVTEPPVTQPPVTEPPVTQPPVTEPPVTQPPVTEPPVTQPPVTEPPVTQPPVTEPPVTQPPVTEPPVTELPSEGELLEPILKPAQITLLRPVASGVLTKSNQYVTIDYSNTQDGYVMVQYLTTSSARLKVQITGSGTTYTYNLTPLEWTVFPLTDGNGSYQIKVFKNVTDNRYSTVISLTCSVSLENEFAPFLRPNQYVNYENAVNTMEKAVEITEGHTSYLSQAEAIYRYVINNISYDYNKAASLSSTYLPDLDSVLAEKKGICFDFAALMTGMLRALGIPCKLVVGYAGSEYHAWINVWSPEEGWINGVIFFNGTSWQHMDPTFAASGAEHLISSTTYTTKYIY